MMPECLKSDTTKRKPTFCQSFVRAKKNRSRHALVEGVVGGVAVGGGNLEIVGDVPREAEVAEETLRSVVRVRVLRRREERVVRLTSIPCLAVVRTHCGVDVDILAGALVIRVVPRKLIVAAEAVTGDRL